MLGPQGETTGEPHRLAANFGKAFQGSNITGMGFVLSYEAVEELIRKSERNKEVLFPFLGGNDILSNPDQQPSRWVINFFDFDEEKASSYVDPFSITKTLVLPERLKIKDETKRKILSRDFWKFNSHAKKLYIKISTMERYLVHPFTGKHNVFQFYGHGITLAHLTWPARGLRRAYFRCSLSVDRNSLIGWLDEFSAHDCWEILRQNSVSRSACPSAFSI